MAGMPQLSTVNNADYIRTVLISTGDQVPRTPYDLTDHIIEMEVRNRPMAAETFISIDNQVIGGITVEDPPTLGQFTIRLPLERLIRMPRGDYYYDVVLTRSDGFRMNLGVNILSVTEGITR